jgi:Ras-related protein Rab-1A
MSGAEYDHLFKILCIGDSSVGKSSLVNRYAEESFDTRFISTIGVDFKIKSITIRGKIVKMQLWDTAGQERFRAITTSYYRGADGVILVYDVTNPESIESLERTWIREVKMHATKNPKMILVGNKCDLATTLSGAELMRNRELLAGLKERLAQDGHVDVIEVSAKTGANVNTIFERLVHSMIDASAERPRTSAKGPEHKNGVVLPTKSNESYRCCGLV